MIYFDYAANTPVDPEVLDVYCRIEKEFFGNPNSTHQAGKLAKDQLESITEDTAGLFGVKPEEIIFTSSGSESNNMALKGLARNYRHKGKHIISTCLEHSSVSGVLTFLQEQGYEITLVDLLPNGEIDLSHLKELLRNDTIIVSVTWIDGEVGVIQPIEKIGAILRDYPNCYFHVDATQAVGKIPVDLEDIDCLACASHKFYGPNGCGALIKKERVVLEPLLHGGVGHAIYRSGTPTLALAASFHQALKQAVRSLPVRNETVRTLRATLEERLRAYQLVRINSPSQSVPHILNLSVKNVKGRDFQRALDEYGVCVSVKSACSVVYTPSRPVYAITKDKKNALCSWRISLSHLTRMEELSEFFNIFNRCYEELTK